MSSAGCRGGGGAPTGDLVGPDGGLHAFTALSVENERIRLCGENNVSLEYQIHYLTESLVVTYSGVLGPQ